MTTTDRPYRPRLSVEITEEQARELNALFPWGLKNSFFQAIVDDVIEIGKKHGHTFLAAVISRKLKAGDFVKGLKDEHD